MQLSDKQEQEADPMKTETADRWLNAPYNAYVRYTHEITEIEKRLIERYGWFFDDTFFIGNQSKIRTFSNALLYGCTHKKA